MCTWENTQLAEMPCPHREEHWNWFGKMELGIKYSGTITSPRRNFLTIYTTGK
jgi:hypothetical protein